MPDIIDLTNREVAFLFWTCVAIAAALSTRAVRQLVVALFKNFLRKHIVIVLLVTITYIVSWIVALAALGAWDFDNLKTTIEWAFTFALVSTFSVKGLLYDKGFFKKTLRDTLSATAVVLFIAESYSFGLIAELILAAILIILSALYAFTESKPGYVTARSAALTLLSIIALGMIGYSIYELVIEFAEFASLHNVREFLLPILLSLLFLPYLYVLRAFMTYETTFMLLNNRISDKRLRSYAKWMALWSFKLHAGSARRWVNRFMAYESKASIRESIQRLKLAENRERTPPPVPSSGGWSPFDAMRFLSDEGLTPDGYNPLGDTWYAEKLANLDANPLGDLLRYSIEGDSLVAKRLELNATSNDPAKRQETTSRFFASAGALLGRALGEGDYNSLIVRGLQSPSISDLIRCRTVRFEQERGTFRGVETWSVTLTISLPSLHES